jgi:hypothetical protein
VLLPERIDPMKMRKILLTVLAGSTFFLALPSNSSNTVNADVIGVAESAKCGIPPFPVAYAAAKAVFVGQVVKVTQNERGKTFDFQVEKYWKGSKSKKASVMVYETSRYQAFYENGKKYLVFASVGEKGVLLDGRCSRSNDIVEAAADMKALGRAKIPR